MNKQVFVETDQQFGMQTTVSYRMNTRILPSYWQLDVVPRIRDFRKISVFIVDLCENGLSIFLHGMAMFYRTMHSMVPFPMLLVMFPLSSSDNTRGLDSSQPS